MAYTVEPFTLSLHSTEPSIHNYINIDGPFFPACLLSGKRKEKKKTLFKSFEMQMKVLIISVTAPSLRDGPTDIDWPLLIEKFSHVFKMYSYKRNR